MARSWQRLPAGCQRGSCLALPLRVTGLVPCAENHVSGSAYRPGDVVRQVGGTTTEVTNTDAEGRLVLADALAPAVRTCKPTTLVDVAALTGAMPVSLGWRTGGLFAPERELAEVGRGETHLPGQRLAMDEDIIERRRVELVAVLGRHLDKIAQHIVVANLEAFDAGLFRVACLQGGDDAARFIA